MSAEPEHTEHTAPPGLVERALSGVTVPRIILVIVLLIGARMVAQDLFGMPPGTPCDRRDFVRLSLLHCQGRWFDGTCATVGMDRYCTYRCDTDADCPDGWSCGAPTLATGYAYDRHDHCLGPPGTGPAEAPMRFPWSE